MAIRGLLAESPLQTCLCGERLQVEDRQCTLDVILAVVAVRGFLVLAICSAVAGIKSVAPFGFLSNVLRCILSSASKSSA